MERCIVKIKNEHSTEIGWSDDAGVVTDWLDDEHIIGFNVHIDGTHVVVWNSGEISLFGAFRQMNPNQVIDLIAILNEATQLEK